MRFLWTLLVMCGVILLNGCDGGSPGDERVVRRDSSGVTIVENRLPAIDTLVLEAPLLTIGNDETQPESLFELAMSVGVLTDGRIVVVDREPRIPVFTADGRWESNLSQAGGGPGEFRVPRSVVVYGDTLAVWDVAARRLLRFSSGFEPLGDIAIPTRSAGHPMLPLAGGWLDEGEVGQGADTARAVAFLVLRDATGAEGDTVIGPYAVPEVGWEVDPATQLGRMVNPPLFSARPVWTASGDVFAWSSGESARVEFRTSGGELKLVSLLPRQRIRVSSHELDAWFGAIGERYGLAESVIATERAATPVADSLPVITALVSADDGTIWVAEHDPGAVFAGVASHWDVLDAEGTLILRVHFPSGFELHAVVDGRAYGVSAGAMGESLVQVFSLAN